MNLAQMILRASCLQAPTMLRSGLLLTRIEVITARVTPGLSPTGLAFPVESGLKILGICMWSNSTLSPTEADKFEVSEPVI